MAAQSERDGTVVGLQRSLLENRDFALAIRREFGSWARAVASTLLDADG